MPFSRQHAGETGRMIPMSPTITPDRPGKHDFGETKTYDGGPKRRMLRSAGCVPGWPPVSGVAVIDKRSR